MFSISFASPFLSTTRSRNLARGVLFTIVPMDRVLPPGSSRQGRRRHAEINRGLARACAQMLDAIDVGALECFARLVEVIGRQRPHRERRGLGGGGVVRARVPRESEEVAQL